MILKRKQSDHGFEMIPLALESDAICSLLSRMFGIGIGFSYKSSLEGHDDSSQLKCTPSYDITMNWYMNEKMFQSNVDLTTVVDSDHNLECIIHYAYIYLKIVSGKEG